MCSNVEVKLSDTVSILKGLIDERLENAGHTGWTTDIGSFRKDDHPPTLTVANILEEDNTFGFYNLVDKSFIRCEVDELYPLFPT